MHERSSEQHSSDSSESSSDDDDDDDVGEDEEEEESNESNKQSPVESNDDEAYNNPSPLSVDRLAKSDHSEGDSPGHIESNGATKEPVVEETKLNEPELPPYLPAIQGK